MITTQTLDQAYMTIIMTATCLDWIGFSQRPMDMYELDSSFERIWHQPEKNGLVAEDVSHEIGKAFPFWFLEIKIHW